MSKRSRVDFSRPEHVPLELLPTSAGAAAASSAATSDILKRSRREFEEPEHVALERVVDPERAVLEANRSGLIALIRALDLAVLELQRVQESKVSVEADPADTFEARSAAAQAKLDALMRGVLQKQARIEEALVEGDGQLQRVDRMLEARGPIARSIVQASSEDLAAFKKRAVNVLGFADTELDEWLALDLTRKTVNLVSAKRAALYMRMDARTCERLIGTTYGLRERSEKILPAFPELKRLDLLWHLIFEDVFVPDDGGEFLYDLTLRWRENRWFKVLKRGQTEFDTKAAFQKWFTAQLTPRITLCDTIQSLLDEQSVSSCWRSNEIFLVETMMQRACFLVFLVHTLKVIELERTPPTPAMIVQGLQTLVHNMVEQVYAEIEAELVVDDAAVVRLEGGKCNQSGRGTGAGSVRQRTVGSSTHT